jgi:hypothetical protein
LLWYGSFRVSSALGKKNRNSEWFFIIIWEPLCGTGTNSSKYLLFGTLNEYCVKKLSTAMTNNSTNINKVNIHPSLQIIEHKNTIICRWKSWCWLWTGTKMWRG